MFYIPLNVSDLVIRVLSDAETLRLTSGMNGAGSIPASRRLKLMEWKMGWSLTSEAPPPRQPSLSAGSLARSWREKTR